MNSGNLRFTVYSNREAVALSSTYIATLERDEGYYIAYCPEVPGANGQRRTKDAARKSLASAIQLILLDR
ncbi:type II toxin-antitoxin system HicB family antitoxin [Thiohalocapsa halophila]|uniref:type II toxin-antitoxin system HicB family antitoxin n=1 Tax=Thiohalocapsa halophila TaxID=69359 RepID=UPI001F5BD11F|nr:type II toxin-antitoxin system HicB family antitoxin [Thiohalocapsa halophila]